MGLHPQLETLCFPEFPQCLLEGLPQPPEPGKGKLAPSVCPPTQPSPVPHGCHGATAVPAQPHSPPHDLRAFSLCSSFFPLGHGWAMAGPPSWPWPCGRGCTWGPLPGIPLSLLQPSPFHSPPPSCAWHCQPAKQEGVPGVWGTIYRGWGPLESSPVFLSPFPSPSFSGAAISADPLTPPMPAHPSLSMTFDLWC